MLPDINRAIVNNSVFEISLSEQGGCTFTHLIPSDNFKTNSLYIVFRSLVYIIECNVADEYRVTVLRALLSERVDNAVSTQGFLHVGDRIHIV